MKIKIKSVTSNGFGLDNPRALSSLIIQKILNEKWLTVF